MPREVRRALARALVLTTLLAIWTGTSNARAYDAPAWTGWYIGGDLAYALVRGNSTAFGPALPRSPDTLGGFLGGPHLGTERRLSSRIVVGVEGDISFPYFVDDGVVTSRAMTRGVVTEKLDFVSTLRARVGTIFGRGSLYATGGLAWQQVRFSNTVDASGTALRWPVGWTAGVGAGWALAPSWTLKAEVMLDRLGDAHATFASGSRIDRSGTTIEQTRLALDWHFDWPGGASTASSSGATWNGGWRIRPESWNVHWQTTFIEQGYFDFHPPYEGLHSLSGGTQLKDTVSATAFVGLRLGQGAEVYVNPEIDQGFGLSQTVGVAAFPNGEAQKTSYPVPRLDIDRVFLRQTFELGGQRAVVEDGPNQLPSVRDVSRVTITVGRFSVGDAFGLNAYAQDPRTQFLNWNVYGSGSYDWTMDQPGFTWGAFAELNERRWAIRVGYFLEPTQSNGNAFDLSVPTHGQYLAEPELRYSLLSLPGTLRLLSWVTRADMGDYAAAVAKPVTSANYPDLTQTRQVRVTYGMVANVEQALSSDLGLFSRASWTPGRVEVMGWTDCDESLSLGASLAGTAWRRPGDTIGLAGVVEGLSPQARAYFAAGGLGIVIGDGHMTYRPEQVVEVYYAIRLATWASLTFDYQLVANPAYSGDRGPVPIYAARLHTER